MVRKTDQVRGLSVSVVHCDEPLDLFPFLPALLSSLDQDLLLVSNPALRHVFALQSQNHEVQYCSSLTFQRGTFLANNKGNAAAHTSHF